MKIVFLCHRYIIHKIVKLLSKIYLRFKEYTLFVSIADESEREGELMNSRKCKRKEWAFQFAVRPLEIIENLEAYRDFQSPAR